jgi:hypothetical protein
MSRTLVTWGYMGRSSRMPGSLGTLGLFVEMGWYEATIQRVPRYEVYLNLQE